MELCQILSIAAILMGLYYFKITTPTFLRIMLVGLSICILGGLSSQQYIIDSSEFTFGILALILCVYCLNRQLYLILFMAFFAASAVLSSFFLYDYSYIFKYLLITPILVFIMVLSRKRIKPSLLGLAWLFALFECQLLLSLF